MTKEFSLKGKKKTVDTKFYQVKPQRGVTTVDVYLAEDVEILRQKLIEDIKNNLVIKLNIDDQDKPLQELVSKIIREISDKYTDGIVDIINKRFGVEE